MAVKQVVKIICLDKSRQVVGNLPVYVYNICIYLNIYIYAIGYIYVIYYSFIYLQRHVARLMYIYFKITNKKHINLGINVDYFRASSCIST